MQDDLLRPFRAYNSGASYPGFPTLLRSSVTLGLKYRRKIYKNINKKQIIDS